MATPPASRAQRPRGDTAGDTLLEVIIAMVIIALAVGPILGTLIESAASSAQHRALATIDTLMKSFAESATSHLELAPATPTLDPNTPVFAACASTYRLISKPSTMKTRAGSAVSVFVTGFPGGATLGTFHVSVGTLSATTSTPAVAIQSQQKSDAAGNMQITFLVPTGLPATSPQPITVTYGPATTVIVMSTKSSGITVSPSTPLVKRSADAHYTMGITSITYWHPSQDAFTTTCQTTATPSKPLRSGVQLVTLRASLPGNARDTLSFVLRDPKYAPPPKPSPAITVVGKSISLPRSGTATLVFVATVSGATPPPPSGTVTWAISGPGGAVHCAPTTPPSTVSAGTTAVKSTCDVPIGTTPGNVGKYTAKATMPPSPQYFGATGPATARVYAADGSGTTTVAPKSAVAASTGNSLVFTYTAAAGGMSNGRLILNVPTGWTAPTTTTGSPGYASATGGAGRDVVSTTGRRIVVTGVTLTGGGTMTITYADATAPATTGPDTFAVTTATTAGNTPVPSSSPPVVDVVFPVTSTTAASTNTLSLATFPMPAGAHFLVYAFSSQSGTGDSATVKTTGFAPTAPTFTKVGSQQNFGPTSADHAWAWYTTGTAAGGTGTLSVKFAKTAVQAYLEVVELPGSTSPPVVTSTEGFHVGATSGTTATASLSGPPTAATDPEVIFLATQGSLGTPAPAVATAVKIGFGHATQGSVAVYTGKARTAQTITIPTNWWGTIALEIHG